MKPGTLELIEAECQNDFFKYITKYVQRGRIRQSTYVHELIIPVKLYEEIRENNIINHEDSYIRSEAFFEFRRDEVIISFQHLFAAEDLHHRIDQYLITKALGYYPIKRAGISRMNFIKE